MSRLQLFKYMLLEDWRQHARLFGTTRFALFPVQITALVAVSTWLLTLTTIPPDTVVFGIHVLVLVFGIQTGSTAFEGSNALENVLGDVTYLLFSTRTLPVTPRELFGIFIVKDILYYTALFILPVTIGLLPFYSATALPLTASAIGIVLVSLVLMFLLGAAAAVIGVTLLAGTPARRAITVFIIAGTTVAVVQTGVSVTALTPYGLHSAATLTSILTAVMPVAATVVASVLLYAPSTRSRNRTSSVPYATLREIIPSRIGLLPVKILLDVKRSSGGLLKVAFTAGLFFAVTAFLIWAVETTLHITLNPGIAFGTLLSLTAFTTHTWITHVDDPEEYLFHPLTVRDVFKAKYVAFAVITAPVGAVFYGAALIYRRPELVDAALGAIVLATLALYVFGVTVYVAGLDPNDFMFDTFAFATFALAIMVAVLPVLIASFLTPLPDGVAVGIIVWSIALAGIGGLAGWAAPNRWHHAYN